MALSRGQLSPEMLSVIMAENEELGHSLHMQSAEQIQMGTQSSFKQAVRMQDTRYVSLVDGIAIIDLIGPIYPRANGMQTSGACSIQQFTADFFKAYENAGVNGIVMHIDSPGGDARGIGEAADMIFAASKRRKKPIKSYVSGYGASAAYWIAAAGQSMTGQKMSINGSIGVVMSGMRKNDNEIEIVSSQSPYKRIDPSNAEGLAIIQRRLDAMADVFITDIAAMRGVSRTKVLSDYGQGDVRVGAEAVECGLLDSLGTLSSVVEEAMSEARSGSISRINRRQVVATADNEVTSILTFDNNEEELDMGLKSLRDKFSASNKTLFDEQEQAHSASTDNESDDSVGAELGTEEVQTVAPATAPAFTREELEDKFSVDAELFATQLTLGHRIQPQQQAHAAGMLINAKSDDVLIGGEVSFIDENGEMATGTREASVRSLFASMPEHTMTQRAVKAISKGQIAAVVLASSDTDDKAKNVPMTEERRKELLSSSQQGRQVLTAKN